MDSPAKAASRFFRVSCVSCVSCVFFSFTFFSYIRSKVGPSLSRWAKKRRPGSGALFRRAARAAHDDLIVADLEVGETLDIRDLDGVPRHVVDPPRVVFYEVVVSVDVRIEDDPTLGEDELAE